MTTVPIYDAGQNRVVNVEKIEKSDAEWKKLLTKKQYEITTRKGTEAPGTCPFSEVHEPGIFQCVRCQTDLFRSSSKFESGTGWPSYYEPISPLNIVEKPDSSFGMVRTEVLCARCGSHLGHVFDDGPPPTGKRYCMNGFALKFVSEGELNQSTPLEVATLAGGCFWCVEAVFREVDGIEKVISGYTGGTTVNPTYQQVCTCETGHAEAVQVTFDAARISYREILEIFFSVHDPTTPNRQGPDTGTQYRSAIFYHNKQQKAIAEKLIGELDKAHLWQKPIVTQIAPLDKFYPADEYHQEYFSRNLEQGYCQVVISPKVNKFRAHWAKRLKK
ncbi:MAG: bifunctional methionine sulfoxide reductase B/A protein [Dehalococcoidales bacterium]|nr:bifunctional methionine sulfoxide reductase B/A protein [Dehalococcoidales bacterium]